MKKKTFRNLVLGILFLGALGIGSLLFLNRTTSLQNRLAPLPHGPRVLATSSGSAKFTPTPSTGRTIQAAPASSGTSSTLKPIFPGARVLSSAQTRRSANGDSTRVSIVKADFKHSYIRLEESVDSMDKAYHQIAMVADHVLVKLKPGVSQQELEALNTKLGARVLKKMNSGLYLVQLAQHEIDSVPEAMDRFQALRAVAYAEPNFIVQATSTPNDPSYSALWGMNNTGQTGGKVDGDIDAPEAWDLTTGTNSVVVAVIDTGADYTHPDLAPNMWTNTAEIPGNGIDDDGDGFIDDVRGWNFYSDSNDPMDDHYHGTHVSGTIGASGNNATGVVGVCWKVRIMPLKFLNSAGSGTTADAIDAVNFATAKRVLLTSNSWGGDTFSQALKDAIDAANSAGILFVAAAGNSALNMDASPGYPASYSSPNVISVAATDENDNLASFSNYGNTTVDLGAPGVNILSCRPGSTYQYLGGTSMATPHVSGACALLKAFAPGLSASEIKARILAGVDPIPSLTGKCVTGGRLNVFQTLRPLSGPFVIQDNVQISDPSGNSDGIANPGETINVNITLKNTGGQNANLVTATLSHVTPNGLLTLIQTNATYGTMAASATASGNQPFTLQISPSATTPLQIPLLLKIKDSSNNSWTRDVTLNIYTSTPITGTVLNGDNNLPIPGSSIVYSGTSSGTLVPDGAGRYTLNAINGTYTLTAKAPGFPDSPSRIITVPPDPGPVNFVLGIPRINVKPASFLQNLSAGQTGTQTMNISNAGPVALHWSISNPLIGQNGYLLSNSDTPGGPTFSWIDISTTGTTITGLGDDSNVGPINIGFSFPFFGTNFPSLRLCSNGFISFTSASSGYNNTTLPTTAAPENLIAFLWDDLNFTATSSAYYKLVDSNTFVIQFKGVVFFLTGGLADCELILKSDGTILMQYLRVDTPAACTVGIQDATMTRGVQAAFNQSFLHANLAVRFAPTNPWVNVLTPNGTTTGKTSSPVSLKFSVGSLALGSYTNLLTITSDDPTNGTLQVPVILKIIPPNQPPVAANDTATTDLGVTATINVLANDTDPDNNPLTIQSVSKATSGTTSVFNNQVRYTPNTGFSGTDSFTYTITDGIFTSTAAVTVTVRNTDGLQAVGLTGVAVGSNSSGSSRILPDGTWEIFGGGTGYSITDSIWLQQRPVTGNFEVTVRFRSLSSPGMVALMVRDSLLNTSRMEILGADPQGKYVAAGRLNQGQNIQVAPLAKTGLYPNIWAGLVRQGDSMAFYISNDGITWTLLGYNNLPNRPQTLIVGISLVSGVPSAPARAVISDFSIVPVN